DDLVQVDEAGLGVERRRVAPLEVAALAELAVEVRGAGAPRVALEAGAGPGAGPFQDEEVDGAAEDLALALGDDGEDLVAVATDRVLEVGRQRVAAGPDAAAAA